MNNHDTHTPVRADEPIPHRKVIRAWLVPFATREIARSLSGPLGTIPNDDDLASIYGYTPVSSGWIFGRRINGKPYYADGPYGSDDTETLQSQLKLQRRQIILQTISAIAITTLAVVKVHAHFRGPKRKRAVGRSRKRR